MGVGVGISFFGPLHKKEVLKINCEDVRYVEEKNQYDVATAFVRKTRAQTIPFELPEYMTTGMSTYLGEIPKKKECLLKNFSAKSKTHIQNMGKCSLHSWPTQVMEMLELDAAGYSSTCWHRSGATSMASSGAGIINLKCAGGWKSSTVAEGYIAESVQMKSLQVDAFAGKLEAKKNVVVAAVKGDDDEKPSTPPASVLAPVMPVSVVINNYGYLKSPNGKGEGK
eukprot:979433-Ditylum_brightwellii.AAC.1